jgi:hypothetical protein
MRIHSASKLKNHSWWPPIGHSRIALVVLAIGFALEIPNPCLARQATTSSEARQSPAPWRPNFGTINPNAANGASESAAKMTSGVYQQNGVPSVNANPLVAPRSAAGSNVGGAGIDMNQTNNSPFSSPAAEPGLTRVTKTLDKLPNSAGQIWREYDISPYTSQIKSTQDPQKAVTEWILRETGTEMWFNQPLGILSADRNRLYVYHTPEIHSVVKGIVDRFVRTRGQIQNIDVNLVTVEKPNWRAQFYSVLQPIEVNSPGVEAWMVSKENAAILISQLSRRPDFAEHSGGRLTNHDGQTFVLEKKQPVQFVRNLRWVPNQVPNYQPLMTTVNEGYRLAISSLSTLDNGSIEAVIKCDVDQVEKLTTVKVNVPAGNGATTQLNLQIPQLVSWRLHERFRWPNDQVLLLSCGVVANPEPEKGRPRIELPVLGSKSNRADALLFIEYRGPASEATLPLAAEGRLAPIRRLP